MSLLCIGISHRSAPVEILERALPVPDRLGKLYDELLSEGSVSEALVLATCNRVEAYVAVEKFHAGVQHVSDSLATQAGLPVAELAPHLYVHYEDRAVAHLFAVASGLDSMVLGESQILGQLRNAYRAARQQQAVGRSLSRLLPYALRVGKRVHAETDIDRAGQSVVSAGLSIAAAALGDLGTRHILVVGAGSMSALALSALRRAGATQVTVLNRTLARAERLAAAYGARAGSMSLLAEQLRRAELVVTATGATGAVINYEDVAAVAAAHRELLFLDLALPRDVAPAVGTLDGVTVVDLEALRGASGAPAGEVDAARALVGEEVLSFLSAARSARVAPTVAALRAKADEVVASELLRLSTRLPELDERGRQEVAGTVRRVVDKLLHAPTVRVKELAGIPGGDSYAEALRRLFDLDPSAPDAIAAADLLPGTGRSFELLPDPDRPGGP
ncbi:MAG: glutamyl-tRNA reductase [Mycobacteriales bacterium]